MSDLSPKPTIHLVASTGGHLDLLLAVRAVFSEYDRVWVSTPSNRATAIADGGDEVQLVPFYGRSPLRLIPHLRRVTQVLRRHPPGLVVTTGAGSAVPFCVVAWLLGAKVIFIETMARVSNASISGRILSRLSSVAIVQWPEMLSVYRAARLCRPVLLSDVNAFAVQRGEGTFVAVGTHVQPFDRLLQTADRAVAAGILPAPARGQSGVSSASAPSLDSHPFIEPDEMTKAIEGSRYIVCHAGSGLISAALRAGRRPLVMSRLKRHGEHVDDHQAQIVQKLGEMDLVVPIEGEITSDDVMRADRPLDPDRVSFGEDHPTIEEAIIAALAAITPTVLPEPASS